MLRVVDHCVVRASRGTRPGEFMDAVPGEEVAWRSVRSRV